MKKNRIISIFLALTLMVCVLCGCEKSIGGNSKSPDEYYDLLCTVLNDRSLGSDDVKALCKSINKVKVEKADTSDLAGKYSKYVVYGDFGSGSSLSAAMVSEIIWQNYFVDAAHEIDGIQQFEVIEHQRGSCACDHRAGSSDMVALSFGEEACICPECAWVSLG